MSGEAKTKSGGKMGGRNGDFKLIKEGMKYILWSLWLINMQMKDSTSQSRRVEQHIKRRAKELLPVCSD